MRFDPANVFEQMELVVGVVCLCAVLLAWIA